MIMNPKFGGLIQHISFGINPIHMSMAALLDGYVDVATYEPFHVYTTMMTGNLINWLSI